MINIGLHKNFDLEEFLETPEYGNASEKVYFFILKKILRGEYKVGSRMTEAQVVESLSISNGPVREAFARLRSDGWIETTPNIGSIVVDYHDSIKFKSLFRDRRIIEIGCCVELAETASFRQLAELEEAIEDIDKGLANKNSCLYREADLRFHYKVVEFIAGQRLFNLWRHSTLQLFCLGYPGPASEFLSHGCDVKLKEASHRALFNAIASHDVAETRKLFLMHINFPLSYMGSLENWPPKQKNLDFKSKTKPNLKVYELSKERTS